MIRHVVMWDYSEDCTQEENRLNAIQVKSGFEDLYYAIEGVLSVRVIIDPLPESSADILLAVLLADQEAFDDFMNHPSRLRLQDFINECCDNERVLNFEDNSNEESQL